MKKLSSFFNEIQTEKEENILFPFDKIKKLRKIRFPFNWIEEIQWKENNWKPKMDVIEKEKKIIIRLEIPGIKKEDIHIHLEKNYLIICGERKLEKQNEKEIYHKIERFYGKFIRIIPIHSNLKEEDIIATLENGILEISYPKPIFNATSIPIKSKL